MSTTSHLLSDAPRCTESTFLSFMLQPAAIFHSVWNSAQKLPVDADAQVPKLLTPRV